MKTLRSAAKTLAAAAILSLMACACNKEQTETPKDVITTVHVNVSAGIDGSNVKSALIQNGSSRQLVFTSGDALYIRAYITGTDKILAGYLSIDGTPASNSTKAAFNGDLTVYAPDEEGYVASSHTFQTNDPLSECSTESGEEYELESVAVTKGIKSKKGTPMAILVHNGSEFYCNEYDKSGYYASGNIAATVEELMTSRLEITGNYDASAHRFNLGIDNEEDRCTAIFDVNVTAGLSPNTTYGVLYLYGSSEDSLYGSEALGEITTDSNGSVKFACAVNAQTDNLYHAIRFETTTRWMLISLGNKTLTDKIYKISRVAYEDPDTPIRPTITDEPANSIVYIGREIQASNYGQPLSFTISGKSRHYCIDIHDCTNCTVKLRNLTAYYNNSFKFIEASVDLTIDVEGDNTIIYPGNNYAISNRYRGDIHVTGNGTLTITSKDRYTCGGIEGNNYYGSWQIDDLAADGTTITVTDFTDNGDGTYTRTFNVTTP